jgi:hypothetical protein
VASPLGEIVAIGVPDELQVTEAVRSAVELSEYVPIAVNCWVAPTALLEFAGVTAIEVRAGAPGAVTVSAVFPETAPDEAVIVVEPAATAVDMPPDEIVAIDVLDELQVTDDVRFTAELSEYVPMAVNCWVAPMTLLVLAGVTAIDVRDGVMTLLPLLPPPPHATRKAIEIIPAKSCADRLFILVPPFFCRWAPRFPLKTPPKQTRNPLIQRYFLMSNPFFPVLQFSTRPGLTRAYSALTSDKTKVLMKMQNNTSERRLCITELYSQGKR